MKFSVLCFLVVTSFFTFSALASQTHEGTAAQLRWATKWNQTHQGVPSTHWSPVRPFSEIENTGYVALSGEDEFELAGLREATAKNLPAGVTLIIYVTDPSQADQIQNELGGYLGDRLKFLQVDGTGNVIWARDSLPFPVYIAPTDGSNNPTFGLVNSIYTQNFEPDAVIAKALSLPMTSSQIVFRGGSLLFDLEANCFAERAREVAAMKDPETFFKKNFACKTVTILDHTGGIGDIDERLKFMMGKEVLTDNANFASILKGRGYTVHMIPSTGDNFETYMNTLLVNGTIFVPQMGISSDTAAVKAYQDLGLNAIGVYTRSMADNGHGNIHCVSMNYPKGSFTPSKRDSRFVEFAVQH